MKKILIYSLFCGLLLGTGCSEDDLTPTIDTTPEYEELLRPNDSSTPADKIIWDWYQKYQTAALYNFRPEDFSWKWDGKINNGYTPFNKTNPENIAMIEDLVTIIQEEFMSKYADDFLKKNLPVKIFLVKELSTDYKETSDENSKFQQVMSNGQDAMIISYLQKDGTPYSSSSYGTELATVFGGFFYDRLPEKPLKFIETRPALTAGMVSIPKDPVIKADLKIKPPFDNDDHEANVCGYIKGYLPTHVKEPTEAADYSDYLIFITGRPGSEIRKLTQFYWRIAMRGSLFIDFYKKVNGEDLIATQNQAFPNDKVSMDDFKYSK